VARCGPAPRFAGAAEHASLIHHQHEHQQQQYGCIEGAHNIAFSISSSSTKAAMAIVAMIALGGEVAAPVPAASQTSEGQAKPSVMPSNLHQWPGARRGGDDDVETPAAHANR
jgi:hypothetical protein